MRHHITHTKACWAILLLPMLGACSSTDDPMPTPSTVHHYLNLTVQVAASRSSRATAADEDDGYASVDAERREGNVSSVTVIFYDADADINDDNSAKNAIVHAYNWKVEPTGSSTSTGAYTTYSTGSRLIPDDVLEGKRYKLLVVANADLSDLNGTSLEVARDYVYDGTAFTYSSTDPRYSFDPVQAQNFVMTSTKEVELDLSALSQSERDTEGRKGTEENPFVPEETVSIERVSARIDLALDPTLYHESKDADGNITERWYEYPVTDNETGKTVGEFRLTNAVPFNLSRMQYLFKHTTEGTNTSKLLVPGRETQEMDNDGTYRATNYVIDPETFNQADPGKVVGTYYVERLFHDNLTENYEQLQGLYHVPRSDNERLTAWTNSEGKSLKYYIMSYSAENTVTAAMQQSTNPAPSSMLSGIRFYGTYHLDGADASQDRAVAFDYLIRHSKTSGKADATQPMAYGIVRNNIYRIYIRSVSRLKGDFNAQFGMAVLPWQYYKHSDVYM